VIELGTVLVSLGMLVIVYLGRMKHQAHPPKWIRNPMMNMLVWLPFISVLVGLVLVLDSVLGSHGNQAGLADELVSLAIFAGAVVLALVIRKRGALVKA